jgi:hypothetical protein
MTAAAKRPANRAADQNSTARPDPGSGRPAEPPQRHRGKDHRALEASGALAAVALALLVLAGGVSAAGPGAAVKLSAPYSGTALHSQSSTYVGCASATDPTAPHFALATGDATMQERAAAQACTTTNGSSTATGDGVAGLYFVQSWNITGNGTGAPLVATWSLVWTSSARVSGNGTLRTELAETDVVAVFTIVDLTTNQTIGTASWSHPTAFNITRGSQSVNDSSVVRLSIHGTLVAGDQYSITTTVSGQTTSSALGTGNRTVTTQLNLANGGNKAVLESIKL